MSELLRATNLVKNYRKGNETIEVLKGINFVLEAGKSVAVVGASGVGKTTLLHILGALDLASSGTVELKGELLQKQTDTELAELRNRSIGFVFQFHYLLPEFTAVENISFPLRMRGVDSSTAIRKATLWLEKMGLANRALHKATELSGGEQQRVAIARALVGEPEIIIADEPTGDLDTDTGKVVGNLLFDLGSEQGRSLIIATHNLELAKKADRVVRLKEGKLLEEVL